VCITRKVVLKSRNVCIITCASQGKLFSSCGMYISSGVHHNESCGKNAVYIHHHVSVTGKVVIKLRNVDIITCASQGKLFSSCGMYISSGVHDKESSSKVAECIYHHVCVITKVVINLLNLYYFTSASQGKLVEGCRMYISPRVDHMESCYKVAEC